MATVTFTLLCHHHHHPFPELFSSFTKLKPCIHQAVTPLATTAYILSPWIWLFWAPHIDGSHTVFVFWWLTDFTQHSETSWFIRAVARVQISRESGTIFHCTYLTDFVWGLIIDGYLCCVRLLVIFLLLKAENNIWKMLILFHTENTYKVPIL